MIFFLCKLFAFPYFLHDSICFKQMRSVQTPFFTFKIPFAVLFYKNTFNVLNLYEKKKFLINHIYNNIWKVKNDLFTDWYHLSNTKRILYKYWWAKKNLKTISPVGLALVRGIFSLAWTHLSKFFHLKIANFCNTGVYGLGKNIK